MAVVVGMTVNHGVLDDQDVNSVGFVYADGAVSP